MNGSNPMSYSWLFNGAPIPDTNSILIITKIQAAQSSYYQVTATNPYGSASSVARISVVVRPSRLVTWGDNSEARGTFTADLTNAVAVAAGDFQTIIIRANGTLAAWGADDDGQTKIPNHLHPIAFITCGANHNPALDKDGSTTAWGDNSYGQLNIPADLANATAVAGGYMHSVALRGDGTVVAWGNNAYNQTSVPQGLTNLIRCAYKPSSICGPDGLRKAAAPPSRIGPVVNFSAVERACPRRE